MFLLPLFVGLLAYRRWSIGRHLKSMDFGREGDFVGPYLAAPPTSARVQNRVEFVELARDMSSNCMGKLKPELEFHAGTTARWYHALQGMYMFSHL